MEPEEGSDNVEETSTRSPSKYLKRLPRLSDLVAKKQEPHPGPRGRHGHEIEVPKAPPSVQPRKLSPPTPEDEVVERTQERRVSEGPSVRRTVAERRALSRSASTLVPMQVGPETLALGRKKPMNKDRFLQTVGLRSGRETSQWEGGINLDDNGSANVRSPPRKRGRIEAPGKHEGGRRAKD